MLATPTRAKVREQKKGNEKDLEQLKTDGDRRKRLDEVRGVNKALDARILDEPGVGRKAFGGCHDVRPRQLEYHKMAHVFGITVKE